VEEMYVLKTLITVTPQLELGTFLIALMVAWNVGTLKNAEKSNPNSFASVVQTKEDNLICLGNA
jgi:hypothetical protein